MSEWMKSGPFTVFDFETTGMSPKRDEIVEIGAVRMDVNGNLTRFESLVNPCIPIPARATSVHGITDEMVYKSPVFKDIAGKFLKFIDGSKLVAHNARFDYSFLQESLMRNGFQPLNGGVYDSVILTRKAFPGLPAYSLQALQRGFYLQCDYPGKAHRAGYDAELTMRLFGIVMDKLCRLYPGQ